MNPRRGEVWLADLNPTKGSEQSGIRPVIIFQNNTISKFSTTVLTIPITTNLKRAKLPTTVIINQGEGGLDYSSVALCHQLRAIDKSRLTKKLGRLSPEVLTSIDVCVIFTSGIT